MTVEGDIYAERHYKKRKGQRNHWKKNGYDQARALGMTLIL